jgi:hypothetical protein
MKKKIIENVKIIIIILIAVTILFAILGSFNISTKENMTTSSLQDDESPQCYPDTVISDDKYAAYNDEIDDDRYILKTKIVPPKGTACPTEISAPASNYLNGVIASSETSQTTSTENSTIMNTNTSITSTASKDSDKNTPAPSESAASSPAAANHNSNLLNDIKGSISQLNQQKDKSESCPPCPACERCPEPAFDCKKVPNYRSPSIGQYMPMPVLTDFSKF